VGNGLFQQHGLPIGDQFLRTLAEQYGAGVNPVDFGAPSAKETIDAWVRRQTAGRIKQLFANLPPETRLVLANTMYLKADWTHPFAKDPTTQDTFHRADGSTAKVPMMHQQAPLRYAAGPGWQAVELPMAGDELAMWVLVPSGKFQPHDLLSPAVMTAVANELTPQQVDLSMPRWDFASEVDLAAQLTRLGLTSAFGPAADFSGISPGLTLDQAIHRANITVDEWGAEAAAVTGLAFVTSGPPPPTVHVRADHPFAFAIVHGPTAVPLFVGHVADPSAGS
jgi:serpin B